MKLRKRGRIILIAVSFMLLLSLTVFSSDVKTKATIIEMKGKVEVSFIGGVWLPAKQGMNLYENDMLRTGENSQARLRFGNAAHSLIKANSNIRIEELKITDSPGEQNKTEKKRNKQIEIKLLKGTAISVLKKKLMDVPTKFRVRTAAAVCGVRGTTFGVKHNEKSEIGVLHGVVNVVNPNFPDKPVSVGAKQKTILGQNETPAMPVSLDESDFKELAQDEKYIERTMQIIIEPEFVDQTYKLVKEDAKSGEYNYTVKIKNVDKDKTKVYLILYNEDGSEYKSELMKLKSAESGIEGVKVYSTTVKFTDTGNYTHRYKIQTD